MRACSLLVALVAAGACSPELKTKSTDGTVMKVDPPPKQDRPLEPCHPECFPAGTLVATPTGPRAIDTLRAGDRVMRIAPDGTAVADVVHSTFTTTNVLVELRTSAGTLHTTPIQPLCLAAGGFRRTGELNAGDRIRTWVDGNAGQAEVTAVVETGRVVPVFNLVVGDSAVFVAGGFLAKGKPPLD